MARSGHGTYDVRHRPVAGKLRGTPPPGVPPRPDGRASSEAATLEGTLLSGRRVRIRVVVVAGEDAHVVFRGEPEDERRLRAVPRIRVAGIRGIGRGTLSRIRTFRGA